MRPTCKRRAAGTQTKPGNERILGGRYSTEHNERYGRPTARSRLYSALWGLDYVSEDPRAPASQAQGDAFALPVYQRGSLVTGKKY